MGRVYELTEPLRQVLRQIDQKNLLGLCVGFLWL